MATAQTNTSRPAALAKRWLVRVLSFAALAICAGWLQVRIAQAVHDEKAPAGLGVGILDGILMPIALPSLLTGKDVPIYADLNTGRTYKLGYVLGVNFCGLVFFGVVFRRFAGWRQSRNAPAPTGPP